MKAKALLVTLTVLVAFSVVSADPLDFTDSKNWKTVHVSGVPQANFIEKGQSVVCLNNWIYRPDGIGEAPLVKGRGVRAIAFDSLSKTKLVGSDSGLYVLKTTDTSSFLKDRCIRSVVYDADSDRVVLGTDKGVSISKLGLDRKPTIWTNTLVNINIHQMIAKKGKVFAVNTQNVYHLVSESWDTCSQFNCPQHADIDNRGVFWVSYARLNTNHTYSNGLAEFDGKTWTEHFNSSNDTDNFGIIRFSPKDGLMYFSAYYSLGVFDPANPEATLIRKKLGEFPWAPKDQSPALSITDQGAAIFGGVYAWVENVAGVSSVRQPYSIVVKTVTATDQIVGIFDPLGRKIAVNSFSRSSAGNYFSWSEKGKKVVTRFIAR
jgi:hypothetical protein